MSLPVVVRTRHELREHCDALRAQGHPVSFVPTMGALHKGHRTLFRVARQHRLVTPQPEPRVVASVFVNPRQFNRATDLANYPRTWEADVEACHQEGVHVLFAPTEDEMYGAEDCTVVQLTGAWVDSLEGAFRPGHFAGVTTVVAKLLIAVGPCTLFLGKKDYQQWRVVTRMVRDLAMPVEVVGVDTVREQDGLAYSSRNRLLSRSDRERAKVIPESIRRAVDVYESGQRDPQSVERVARESLQARVDSIDYVSVRDAASLSVVSGCERPVVLAIAVWIGGVRLIDNVVLGDSTVDSSVDLGADVVRR
jgi:pantoate--beta-alanine ligase